MTTDQYQAMRFQAANDVMNSIIVSRLTIEGSTEIHPDKLASIAVNYADALLKELGIEEPKE